MAYAALGPTSGISLGFHSSSPFAYTVSRAKTIYHAIAGSGAKISANFMDAGLFFHIAFPI
jgi:hypothetical protein